jgi:hypothetical protein
LGRLSPSGPAPLSLSPFPLGPLSSLLFPPHGPSRPIPSSPARASAPLFPLAASPGPRVSAPLLLPPFFSGATSLPEIPGELPSSGPHVNGTAATLQRAAPPICTLTLAPASPEDLQRRRPFFLRRPSPLRHRGHAVAPRHSPREPAHQHRLTTPELQSHSPATSARSSVRISPRAPPRVSPPPPKLPAAGEPHASLTPLPASQVNPEPDRGV